MRDHAVELARRGFELFKLPQGQKAPPPKGYIESATSDPARVAAMWTDVDGESLHDNIGICTGRGLLVLDVDIKGGK